VELIKAAAAGVLLGSNTTHAEHCQQPSKARQNVLNKTPAVYAYGQITVLEFFTWKTYNILVSKQLVKPYVCRVLLKLDSRSSGYTGPLFVHDMQVAYQ